MITTHESINYKDDIWIISTDPTFPENKTWIGRSVFHGLSGNQVEVSLHDR
jgi:hypothetical protein